MTLKSWIILGVIAIVGICLGRLLVRAIMNLFLGGSLIGGNFLWKEVNLWEYVFYLIVGSATKFMKPTWAKKYNVEWSDKIGTLISDVSYGDKESNKFDMYLPKDNTKKTMV